MLNPLHVVLVRPRNPLNIGAAARAVSNFGFSSLRLVDPYRVAAEEAKSGVNAGPILSAAQEFATVGEAVADCVFVAGTASMQAREQRHTLHRLEQGAAELNRMRVSGPVALLFGSEKFGLENDDLSFCHALIRIPTREAHSSMNLGQSVAVCLYELIRSDAAPEWDAPQRATSAELDRMTELLLSALTKSGYVHSPSTELKVRRMVRRLELPPHDAEVWHGILRQILWKLDQ